jgi:hypothetical protein
VTSDLSNAVIDKVLEEEGGKRSLAAKRLRLGPLALNQRIARRKKEQSSG